MYRAQDMPPRVSKALALPAPTGGINDLDPLSNMDASFLIDSMNFFPDTGILIGRPGYQKWTSNIGAPVDTIMSYNATDGTFDIFAGTNIGVFDITSGVDGPPPIPGVQSTNGYWEYVNYGTPAGQWFVAVNGVDPPLLFDGTIWRKFVEAATPAGPGEIKGTDPNKWSFVFVHKQRLWFIEKDTMTAWYLPIDAVGGEVKPFYLGGVFRRGGHLVALARWSSDTGEGLDDRLIFASSGGELASYAGTDPSDANNWTLDSIFFVAEPLSRRSLTDYGGDVIFLCRRGLVPLSSLIAGRSNEIIYSGALTKRISRTLIRLTSLATPPFPAEVQLHNDFAWIIISLFDPADPIGLSMQQSQLFSGTDRPVQLVMNFLTGAWGKFNYPAKTFRSINHILYMGTTDGNVYTVTQHSFVDKMEKDGSGGVPILLEAMGAYTYLNNPTVNKHAKLVRPVFQTSVKPSFVIRVLPDFRLDQFTLTPPPNPAVGNARWDVSFWDQANWAGLENIYRPWVSANVLGYSFAWQMKVSISSATGLAAFEWVWEEGGYV